MPLESAKGGKEEPKMDEPAKEEPDEKKSTAEEKSQEKTQEEGDKPDAKVCHLSHQIPLTNSPFLIQSMSSVCVRSCLHYTS